MTQKTQARWKRNLDHASTWALGIFGGVFISMVSYESIVQYAPFGGTKLTTGEADMMTDFFGENFETSAIRKKTPLNIFSKKEIATTSNKNNIVFWDQASIARDFSTATRPQKNIFMHEAVHLWQKSIDYAQTNTAIKGADYDLVTGKDFSKYGTEQQSAMIEDYMNVFLQPIVFTVPIPLSAQHKILRDVVEAQFPNIIQRRLQKEATQKTMRKILQKRQQQRLKQTELNDQKNRAQPRDGVIIKTARTPKNAPSN